MKAPRGRARQLNAGFRESTGSNLLFLHADSTLPDDALTKIVTALSLNDKHWGRFNVCFDQKGFAWMRFSSASIDHISFNLRHKGSKLEDSIVFNASYDNMKEIENLEGVPHKLGLESGIFLNDKINKKELIEKVFKKTLNAEFF